MGSNFHERKTFTALEVEAALCVWEDICAISAAGKESERPSAIGEAFNSYGSSGMRAVSIQAGTVVLACYDEMKAKGYEFADSYDWEFVPAVVNRIDWPAICLDNQYNGPAYTPDIPAMFADMLASDAKRKDPSFYKLETEAERWKRQAVIECKRQWAYAGLAEDHAERFAEAAERRDQTPADFVKWIGEKYDLIPASDW